MSIPIVGIGASAGGLEALTELLEALPASCNAAFVVVQHLDPTHESLLTEILGRKIALPTAVARDDEVVKGGHVYVIPPNATLTVTKGRLHLAPRAEGRGAPMPVDSLFRSMAEDCGESAVSVVLSGADGDGALGTQAIKHAGGITFAQEPGSARFAGMPRSAIDTGCVDFILRPQQIAGELVRLVAHPYLTTPPRSVVPEETQAARGDPGQDLRRVFQRLRTAHGVDFSRYKPSTLRRRLARRMALHRIDGLAEYLALVESDPGETAALYQDFLIRVTGFFRDPQSFDGLVEHVFPRLGAQRSPREPIRIWVPGCASGEEVYSIAITLVEYLGESLPAIQIFGTDVSETAIDKARAGLYPEAIAQDVSPERLQRFFVRQDSHYCISRQIRDLCIFARQDVTRDPPFSRLDLISCRNVLIYLGSAAQQRVMQIFHYALRPNGFLMLGPSESVGQASDFFELTDKVHRIWGRRTAPAVALLDGRGEVGASAGGRPVGTGDVPGDPHKESVLRQADRLLLARYAPAAILVDEALNILQFRGDTGPYLAPASGPPSLNLQRVIRPELLVEIAPSMQQARDSGGAVRRVGLRVEGAGDVAMEVVAVSPGGAEPCYLILFEDESRQHGAREARRAQSAALADSEKDRRNAHLERENAGLREFLQATMEQHEAAQEELKSAHEEVLSANEEFQSTNEELETSKEELQSANEELTTTNDELRDRNLQLGVLNAELDKARRASDRERAYADGIVETIREPVLVLDSGLGVLRANQAFFADFNLRSIDVLDRPLFEVSAGRWGEGLRDRLTAVLAEDAPMSDFETTFTDRTGTRRVLSLNARRIPGDSVRATLILLSMEDVTERSVSADSLREGIRRKDEFLAMLAHELRNPLGPISHAVHLLKRGMGDAPKLYEMIDRQTVRLVRLVDELLDVARISRGLIELKREPVSLTQIVRESAEASRPRVEQRRHVLELLVPEAQLYVDGDAVRLEQVIANLIENAVKYTEPGGRVAVSLTQVAQEAVLSVADSGIGLEAKTLERIFDPFTQVDSSLARAGGGLGLGLTVVRRVLDMHGGRIEARSAGLGSGSEFVVRIPLLPEAPRVQERDASVPAAADGSRARRVLIVDDNRDAAESLALLVRSWGHQSSVAHDAAQALDIAGSFSPETALVDIGLPDMDGYELARRLRADAGSNELHLVAVTGYGTVEDRTAAREAGFDAHLVKPARPEELSRVLSAGR